MTWPLGSVRAEAADAHGEVIGIIPREVPGCGVAAFAARAFAGGEVVLRERALLVSAVSSLDGRNRQLWEALVSLDRSRRLPAFEPAGHLGALCALRDLGVEVCRQRLLTKCIGPVEELPSAQDTKREAAVLRAAVREKLVPFATRALASGEYARLRQVFRLNGFRYNGPLQEGAVGYDVGEVLFDKVSRINHSCKPNLSFELSDQEERGVTITVKASEDIQEGEEVNISYLPAETRRTLPAAERRRQLRAHWLFDCGCSRCRDAGSAELERASCGASARPEAASPSEASAPGFPAACEQRRHSASSSRSSSQGVCWDDLADPDG